MEYLKDWRIWLMCLVVVIVIQLSDWAWAESHNYKPEKKKTTIDLKFNDLKFKWKLNKVEAKYKIIDNVNFRVNFTAKDFNEADTLALFTFEF